MLRPSWRSSARRSAFPSRTRIMAHPDEVNKMQKSDIIVLIYLLMQRRRRVYALGAFVSLIAFVATAAAMAVPKGTNASLAGLLHNHWSAIHILSCLIAYASFVLAFGCSLLYMLQERVL